MKQKSEKSIKLYQLLLERGYPEPFADEVSKNLNTDFTAQRMLGYLSHHRQPSPEVLADEMLAILSDRNRIMQKKQLESNNASYNEYLNRNRPEETVKVDLNANLYIRQAAINWDKVAECSYVREIEAIKHLREITFHKPVTFFVGENGSGKSTMLEAIAVAAGFNPEGVTRNYSFSTHDSHSELHEAIRLIKGINRAGWGYFLRAESFYNVASQEEEYARYPGAVPEKLHKKSHGESFLYIAQNHFKSHGLYFLDEPEAALSPQRQLTLLMEIDRCAKEDSQFIIVTHSPILLGLPGAEILSFDDGEVHPCKYEETDSYQVTEMFVNHREQLLGRLLE